MMDGMCECDYNYIGKSLLYSLFKSQPAIVSLEEEKK